MEFRKFGDFVKIVDRRNTDLKYQKVSGINIKKNFIDSVANLSETDLSKYKIIEKGQFAYSAMQVGRDETIRIALYYQSEPAIISPAYLVLEVKNQAEMLPEFLMMWFNRNENDRFGWFISDGSVRASLEFERLCEIEIPFIPIEEQKKFVDVFNALQKNQKTYEDSLEDLQLICEGYIENIIKTEDKKLLGEYIQECNVRNNNLQVSNLKGISTGKTFVETKANMQGVELHNYKIVKRNQFAYVADTSRRGDKIAIAMNNAKDCIISSIYTVFEVNNKELLPEYLLLWFSRPEFDRYARYHSWGSARETFNWDDLCNVKLPIPNLEFQEAIVTVYKTLETRKKLNETLKESLVQLCLVLMKGVRDRIEN